MTERKIQDYLHFYLPIQVELDNGGSKVYNRTAVAVGNMDDEYGYVLLRMGSGLKAFTHPVFYSDNRVKPILRRLSDMTEEEIDILKAMDIRPDESVFNKIEATATMNNWLRKNGFDIDRLIESNLAIDKSTLKP